MKLMHPMPEAAILLFCFFTILDALLGDMGIALSSFAGATMAYCWLEECRMRAAERELYEHISLLRIQLIEKYAKIITEHTPEERS